MQLTQLRYDEVKLTIAGGLVVLCGRNASCLCALLHHFGICFLLLFQRPNQLLGLHCACVKLRSVLLDDGHGLCWSWYALLYSLYSPHFADCCLQEQKEALSLVAICCSKQILKVGR